MLREIFCKHKWYSHSREKYEWKEKEPVPGTGGWFAPTFYEQEYSEVKEVLICSKCGKIKFIKY